MIPHDRPLDLGKSREHINNLRAEGKCFICEQTGHNARDCAEKKIVRPSEKLENNNILIRFEEVENFARNEVETLYASTTGLGLEFE